MVLLIVDDEAEILNGILEGVDWKQLEYDSILTAKSYEQAIGCFATQRIDVLLCDIEMGDKNGLDLILEVNKSFPETECIILSCHDDFTYARAAVSLKCLNYVLKPVPYEILTEELQKASSEIHRKQKRNLLEEYGKSYMMEIREQVDIEEQEDLVREAVKYIKEHITEDILVETVAEKVCVSSRHLSRLFKQEFHKTVKDYISDQKMLLAGQILRDSNLSITMVADKVGYGNYSYFIKLFRKYYGMTPREFQKKEMKEKGENRA